MSSGRPSRPLSGALILLLLISMGTTAVAAEDDTPWWEGPITEVIADLTITNVCQSTMLGWIPLACTPDLWPDTVDGDASVVHSDIYSNALIAADNREQLLLETRSHLNQTYGIGVSKAKTTLVKGLNNNTTSESEAKQAALDVVDEFYSTQQLRVISYRNRELLKLNESLQTAEDHTGLTMDEVVNRSLHYGSGNCNVHYNPVVTNSSVQLANGTTVESLGFQWSDPDGDLTDCPSGVELTETVAAPNVSVTGGLVNITDPVSNNTTAMLASPPYSTTWDQVQENLYRAQQNVIGMSTDIWDQYQAGEISVPDALGPLESLIQASTNYEDTGFYSYRALSMVQLGRATNASYAFEVQWSQQGSNETQTSTGQLFVAEDNTTIMVNTTYDASNMTAWLVHPDGNGSAIETPLTGTFTVLSMVNTDTGEPVNQTSVQQTRFYTAGTQDLQEQLDRQNQLLQQLLEQQDGGLIGGSQLWDWFTSELLPGWATDPTTLAVIGFGVLFLLAQVFGA